MRLTGTEETGKHRTVMLRARARAFRMAIGFTAMAAVTVAAATFHVKPTFAAAKSAGAGVQDGMQAGAPVPAAAAKPSAAVPAAQVAASGVTALPDEDTNAPKATAGKGSYAHRWVGTDGKKYVTVNRDLDDLTPEERKEAELELKRAGEELKFDDAKLKVQMEELKKSLAAIDLKKQIDAAKVVMDDPKLKQQLAELQKQMASPEWQRQIAEAAKDAQLKVFETPEWRRQMEELSKGAQLNALKGEALQKQLAGLGKDLAAFNAEKQVDMANSMLNSAQIREELSSGELKAKLDAAQKMLDEARKQMDEMKKR